ncbi:hypothetical protein EVAR_54346_1 [Eumeta japonica]|uniref:Uncharacterized protein n=1 Tax=Eumeta variegata TaxID=151549 RepID=A0A4C1Z8T7_EUMVA|nr:hypothetical protein EVAR_54346_1 [Eumeta japonica]
MDGASTLVAGATEAMQVDDVFGSISKPGCIDIDYVCCMGSISNITCEEKGETLITKIVQTPMKSFDERELQCIAVSERLRLRTRCALHKRTHMALETINMPRASPPGGASR